MLDPFSHGSSVSFETDCTGQVFLFNLVLITRDAMVCRKGLLSWWQMCYGIRRMHACIYIYIYIKCQNVNNVGCSVLMAQFLWSYLRIFYENQSLPKESLPCQGFSTAFQANMTVVYIFFPCFFHSNL